ncbi:hypothetical protein ACWF0M_00650 [Kribbella sp. NPDC055110]
MEKLTRTSYRDLAGDEGTGPTSRPENLIDQEKYYQPLERLHGGTLHEPGVAAGLQVSATVGSPKLTVSPGVALDARGRHIALAEGGLAIVTPPTAVTVPADGLVVGTGSATAERVLTIEWAETFDREAFESGRGNVFRFNHSPKVLLRPATEVGPDQVVLAAVSLQNGNVAKLDAGARTGAWTSVDKVLLRRPAVRDAAGRKIVDDPVLGEIGTSAEAVFVRVPAGGENQPALTLSAKQVQVLTTDGREALGVDRAGGEVRASRLTVPASGRLGVGTSSPQASLQVKGGAIMPEVGNGATAGIQFPVAAAGAADQAYLRYHVATGGATRLVLGVDSQAGDALVLRQQGADRLTIAQGKVGIGTSSPQGALQVKGGPITPEVGSGEAGIMWPPNPGGGAADRAYIRYSVLSGESTRLEIGNDNDADDVVVLRQGVTDLMTLRNQCVGIGTSSPAMLLDVNGAVGIQGRAGLRSDSTDWLTLNPDRAFTTGVYTPLALNVSGRITANGVAGGNQSQAIWGSSDEPDGTGVQGDCHNGGLAAGVYGRSTTGYGGWFEGKVRVQGDILIEGNSQITGTKAAVMRGRDGAVRAMYAVESPDCWFEDFGFGTLENGRAEVTLDDEFVALIGEGDYHVFLSEYDANNGIHVAARRQTGFQVVGAEEANSQFSYRVVAKRYDVQVTRFEELQPPPTRNPRADFPEPPHGPTTPDSRTS